MFAGTQGTARDPLVAQTTAARDLLGLARGKDLITFKSYPQVAKMACPGNRRRAAFQRLDPRTATARRRGARDQRWRAPPRWWRHHLGGQLLRTEPEVGQMSLYIIMRLGSTYIMTNCTHFQVATTNLPILGARSPVPVIYSCH